MFDEARTLIIGRNKDLVYLVDKLEEQIQNFEDENENLRVQVKLYKDSLDKLLDRLSMEGK
jgi:pyrimidine operon attenuation protein/uracil phosphoribosyltransferase